MAVRSASLHSEPRPADEIQQAREYGAAQWDEGHKSGLLQGKRDSLLQILGLRGVALTEVEQDRIAHCSDLGRLDHWLKNALTASNASEVFA